MAGTLGKRCIVTLGRSERPPDDHPEIVRDFRPALRRLRASLIRTGYEGALLAWERDYPPGSPLHRDSPYGFKPFCFLAAADQGHDVILWLDATVQAIRPIDDLFDCIEQDGYVIFAEDHSVGEYCKDDALTTLGIRREESLRMPSCWACALGLDLRQARARTFLRTWRDLATDGVTFPGPRWSGVRGFPRSASADSRVKGHRHDQTAASVLALQLGMRAWKPKEFFSRYLRNDRRWIPTYLPDAEGTVTQHLIRVPDDADAHVDVLYFSRGRGRGHAIPDLAIAESLRELGCHVRLQFVSYATGAETFRANGWPVIDLGFPETSTFLGMLTAANALIRELQPRVVVAHEEPSVLPAARLAGVPAILLTEWFASSRHVEGEAIGFADAVVVMGEPGIFPVPVPLKNPPRYTGGPVVRVTDLAVDDRDCVRAELGLPLDAFVICVVPGAWATEERAPIAHLVLPAFEQLRREPKYLLWLSKRDHATLSQKTASLANARVLQDIDRVERAFVASDVVVTKGNRGSIVDAASLGIPSISISYGFNPVDEVLVPRIHSNRPYNVKALDAATLCAALESVAVDGWRGAAAGMARVDRGGTAAARALIDEISRLVLTVGATAPV